ncbi:nucleotide excision repair complex XPC-HR23B, subunit XPC/DPB11 [Phyllosticta capitalensis]
MAKARATAARKAAGAARGRGRVSTRATRQKAATKDEIPSVYMDMLSGEGSSHDDEGTRPLKKRKIAESKNEEAAPVSQTDEDVAGPESEPQPQLQTVIDDSESDSDGMDWEDVDIGDNADYLLKAPDQQEQTETLEINVGDSSSAQPTLARARRKALTAAEKRSRVQLHKMHLLCLLFNSHIRNAWCNDEKVQASLKRFLNAKLKSFFSPDPNQSQFTAATAFTNGLGLAVETWKKFKLTSVGMRRAKWARDSKDLEFNKIFENLDSLADVSDLRKAAVAFEGSADTGAMLLCAFLRAAGVETRLVCSLQTLPFSAAGQPPPPTSDDQKNKVYAEEIVEPASPKPTPPKRVFGRRGFGGQLPSRQSTPLISSKKQTAMSKPSYPVYWVEAFNAAQQKWIPVDAIATGTVGKPSRLEPPLSDSQVSMSYVLAFEDSGVAKDVTRRYAKAYNAKTLKTRIESTPEGIRWYRRALKLFKRGDVLDRDQIEDAELAKREAAEELPKSIQDFKNHPHFVLERHLRHNEVIHPKREVGQVNLGTAARTNLAPIYRRRDVHALKSADKWFRLGRIIKPGEQPLKHGKPRRGTAAEADGEDDEAAGVGLYAGFQTEPYVAPPVSPSGRVPRNAFGNLDVYVPSMVPPGGAHVRHPRARQAAKLLGIDYADAVTGFKFKGRHGTAVIEGVVVAAENREGVEAVVQGLAEMEAQQERSKRSKAALRLWRKFYRGLAIVRRVQEEYGTAEEKEAWRKEMEEVEREEEREAPAAGGFLPAMSADEPVAEPTAGRFIEQEPDVVGEGGGFLPESEEPSGSLFDSRIMDHTPLRPRASLGLDGTHDDGIIDGGGFIPEDGGGFIPDGGAGGFIPEPAAFDSNREATAEREDASLFGDGGGFIPDDEAGGFVRETEDPRPPTESSVLKGKGKAIEAHDGHLEKPSSVPPAEDIIPVESQSPSRQNEGSTTGVEQVDVDPAEGSPQAKDAADSPMKMNGQSQAENTEGIIGLKDLQETPAAVKGGPLETAVADSESERDSLPSHDPEDEDAEPEWLLSD